MSVNSPILFVLKTVVLVLGVLVVPVLTQTSASPAADNSGIGDLECINSTCPMQTPPPNESLTSVTEEMNENLSPDVDENSSAKKIHSTVSFVLYVIISPILHPAGIIGNILVLIVLYQGAIKSPSKPYFIGMALADLFLLLTSLPVTLRTYVSLMNLAEWKTFYAFSASYLTPFNFSFHTAGTWIIVAFTTERFIAICFPMKAQTYCTRRRARVTVICMYIFGFAENVPNYFKLQPVKTYDVVSNNTFYDIGYTLLGKNPLFTAIDFWRMFVFDILLPFCCLTILNCLIVRRLTMTRSTRTSMTSTNLQGNKAGSRDDHVTRMLLCIVAAFFICHFATGIVMVIAAVRGNSVFLSWEFRILFEFAKVIGILNSVLNCPMYTLCSKSVRSYVLRLLFPCYRVKPKPKAARQNTLP